MIRLKKFQIGMSIRACNSSGRFFWQKCPAICLILTLFVSGCRTGQETGEIAVNQGVQNFRQGKLEKIAFLNSKGITHQFSSGIKLEFAPGIFDASADDSLFLETADYTRLPEMVQAGIGTTSGDRLLETNGMVWCKAINRNSAEVNLKAGRKFRISFPANPKNGKGDFMLFSGREKDGRIDWVNPRPQLKVPGKQSRRDSDDASKKKAIKHGLEITAYGIQNELELPDDVFAFKDTSLAFFDQYFEERYSLPPLRDLIPLKPYGSYLIFFSMTPAGKLIFRGGDFKNPAFLKSIKVFFESLPPMKAYGNADSIPVFVNITVRNPLSGILLASRENLDSLADFDIKVKLREEEQAHGSFSSQEEARIFRTKKKLVYTQRYLYEADGLGWINCDRFIEQNQVSVSVNFIDQKKFSGMVSQEPVNKTLIFPNLNGIIAMADGSSAAIPGNQPLVPVFYFFESGADSVFFYSKVLHLKEEDLDVSLEWEKIPASDLEKRTLQILADAKKSEDTRRPDQD
jgi:hypothetical protein